MRPQQIGAVYGISKTRAATILREQGVTIRRKGLTDEQVTEAVGLYDAGRSLAGSEPASTFPTQPSPLRFGGEMSKMRPRPGWTRAMTPQL